VVLRLRLRRRNFRFIGILPLFTFIRLLIRCVRTLLLKFLAVQLGLPLLRTLTFPNSLLMLYYLLLPLHSLLQLLLPLDHLLSLMLPTPLHKQLMLVLLITSRVILVGQVQGPSSTVIKPPSSHPAHPVHLLLPFHPRVCLEVLQHKSHRADWLSYCFILILLLFFNPLKLLPH